MSGTIQQLPEEVVPLPNIHRVDGRICRVYLQDQWVWITKCDDRGTWRSDVLPTNNKVTCFGCLAK